MNSVLTYLFNLHDFFTNLFVKHLVLIKKVLLFGAHLAIFGFFFPELRKSFGEQALNVLLFLLFLSPLSKILRMRLLFILMSYRRQFGILMAYLATVHVLGYLSDPLFTQAIIGQSFFPNIWHAGPRYLAGILAYILTLPLLLTSNNTAVKLLGKNWKRLHFLVYFVFIFAVFHKFTIGRGLPDTGSVIQAVLLIFCYLLLKWWAYHGLPLFLEEKRNYIASKYRDYSNKKLLT